MVPLTNGDILVLGYAALTSAVQSTLMTRVPASEIPVKTRLTLGVSYLSYTIRQLVLSFNRENGDYRVIVRDYSEYSTDENPTGWLDQLEMDMLSGDCPDILYLSPSEVDLENYAQKGYLLDLYTMMGEDTVEKEDFVPSYLAAMEQDGELYAISTGFRIFTLLAPPSAANENGTWTMEEFAALAQNYTGDGQVIWNYMLREDVLTVLLSTCYSAFVDTETGKCSFDSEKFQALLELCMLFPEDYEMYYEMDEQMYADGAYYSDAELIQQGVALTTRMTIYSMDYMRYSANELGNLALVGYPGVGGSGAVMCVDDIFAISAYSDYPEAAWSFVATTLTEAYAENISNLSVLQSCLEEQAAVALEKPYYYDENGEKVEYSDDVLTQEQVDYLLDIIENTESLYHYDEEMITIVLEETAAYFAGQKDAATVAALIQDRVQTYLDEQG